MPSTKISVIVTTVRMGGLDVLFYGLRAQEHPPEYEVILVDSCFAERKEFMSPTPTAFPPNWYHVELPDTCDHYDACFANNYGLKYAQGELVIFLTDNIWPEPYFLERHWQVYQNFPGYSMNGFIDRYDIPPIKENLTWETGWWSIFQKEFDAWEADRYFGGREPYYQERKGNVHLGMPVVPGTMFHETPGDFFYGALNESVPMSVLKEINGWNEELDGGYGCADIELGMRANIAGHKFVCVPFSINLKLGQRQNSLAIPGRFKKDMRTPDEQRMMVHQIIDEIQRGKRSVRVPKGAWS